jgi:hypothetical protein
LEPTELEEYENKLLAVIENLRFDEELLSEAYKVINHHSLEMLLMKTTKVKIVEAFANDFVNEANRAADLAEAIAKNKYTPDAILNKLAQVGGCGYIGYAVANNTSTSTITLLWMHKYCDSLDIHNYTETQLIQRRVILEDDGNIQEF